MSFDYSKLNGRIVEICGTQAAFARKMGKSPRTISLKLNNKIPWTQTEMHHAADILKLDGTDIPDYFFVLQVQNA